MTFLRFLLIPSLLLFSWASASYASLEQEVVTNAAYDSNINSVSFQQDAIVTYNGYQYAVYWSRNKHVAVARKALPSGNWETLELTDFQFATANAHYDISMGISPRDGTLHLSFDQWSSDFRYRKSVANLLNEPQSFSWSSSLFEPLQNGLSGSKMSPTTYPRFITQPSGKLLFLLRHGESGAGDSFLYEYDGNTAQWTTLGKLVDGFATDINAYFNGMHYDGNGRLHATWVWRATPNASSNFDLHYIYSDDDGRTWSNNVGEQVAITGRTPITEGTRGITVWNIAQNRGLINQESQAVDSQGRVSMLMSHLRDGEASNSDFEQARHKAHVFHYMRDLSGKWTRQTLAGSSFSYDRNKIVSDGNNNLYAIINRDGIYRAQASQQWQDWSLVQSIADHTLYGEVQIDRERILDEGVLSFLNLAAPGFMNVYNFTDTGADSNSSAGGGPEGYVFCALEGESCNFSGARDIAFGASGKFYHRIASNTIACNKDALGEPIRGTVKRCYYSSQNANTSDVGPIGYELCAEDGEVCVAGDATSVAYGSNGQFNYRITGDTIDCGRVEFGSLSTGSPSRCYLYVTDSPKDGGNVSSTSSSSSSTSSSSSASSGGADSDGGDPSSSSGELSLYEVFLLFMFGAVCWYRSHKGH